MYTIAAHNHNELSFHRIHIIFYVRIMLRNEFISLKVIISNYFIAETNDIESTDDM